MYPNLKDKDDIKIPHSVTQIICWKVTSQRVFNQSNTPTRYRPLRPCLSQVGRYTELSHLGGMILNLFSYGEIFSQTHEPASVSIQTSTIFAGLELNFKRNLLILPGLPSSNGNFLLSRTSLNMRWDLCEPGWPTSHRKQNAN